MYVGSVETGCRPNDTRVRVARRYGREAWAEKVRLTQARSTGEELRVRETFITWTGQGHMGCEMSEDILYSHVHISIILSFQRYLRSRCRGDRKSPAITSAGTSTPHFARPKVSFFPARTSGKTRTHYVRQVRRQTKKSALISVLARPHLPCRRDQASNIRCIPPVRITAHRSNIHLRQLLSPCVATASCIRTLE